MMRKLVTVAMWFLLGLVGGLFLVAPRFGLRPSEAVFLSVLVAPIVGILFLVRWLLRPKPKR